MSVNKTVSKDITFFADINISKKKYPETIDSP